jgi:hypothetical protein
MPESQVTDAELYSGQDGTALPLQPIDLLSALSGEQPVERSTLPPRQKPYLPKLGSSKEVKSQRPASLQRSPAPSDDDEPEGMRTSDFSKPMTHDVDLLEALAELVPDEPPARTTRRKDYLPGNEAGPIQRAPQPRPKQHPSDERAMAVVPQTERTVTPAPPTTRQEQLLLGALDLPADTPIQGSWNAPAESHTVIQRVTEASGPATENASSTNEPRDEADETLTDEAVESLAQQVLKRIRGVLRSERERRDLR